MSQGDASDLSSSPASEAAEADDKYLVRNPRQTRRLLQALIEQRSTITVHVAGRDQFFATAILEVDEDDDWMLLDGSANDASNRAAEQATHLLCFAQLSHVRIRFHVEKIERVEEAGRVAFRAPLPETLYYLQRRESYRLQTPVTESPLCVLRIPGTVAEEDCEIEVRVADISGGGIAIVLTPGMPELTTRMTYHDCRLKLPQQAAIPLSVTVCSQSRQAMPAGLEYTRAGLQFGALPRGADELIQRYIFRMERQRSARNSGVF